MKRRKRGRGRNMARLRQKIRPESVMLGFAAAAFLAFQTWSEHHLDTLRQERVHLEESVKSTRADLAAARMRFSQESAQDRVVARARRELGFVDCPVGERVRVALPTARPVENDALLERFARGLDRFSGVRGARAAEEER